MAEYFTHILPEFQLSSSISVMQYDTTGPSMYHSSNTSLHFHLQDLSQPKTYS